MCRMKVFENATVRTRAAGERKNLPVTGVSADEKQKKNQFDKIRSSAPPPPPPQNRHTHATLFVDIIMVVREKLWAVIFILQKNIGTYIYVYYYRATNGSGDSV